MTNLNELIDISNKLSKRLEDAANDEKSFCIDFQLRFESMAWECLRLSNEIKEIKYYTQ